MITASKFLAAEKNSIAGLVWDQKSGDTGWPGAKARDARVKLPRRSMLPIHTTEDSHIEPNVIVRGWIV
jgi:hypothetical protein